MFIHPGLEPHIDKCYGKYRGIVVDNLDPENRGRLLVQVPSVFHAPVGVIAAFGKQVGGATAQDIENATPRYWAEPCFPYGGLNLGFMFIPKNQSRVWVEFEAGDTNFPIWTGVWTTPDAGKGAVPSEYINAGKKLIRTEQHIIELDDNTGEFHYKGITNQVEITVAPNGLVTYNIPEDLVVATSGLAKINIGTDGQELAYKSALETLKAQLDSLVAQYNVHTHVYVDTPVGTSITAPIIVQAVEPMITPTGTTKTKAG
jgi:molybdopterin-binding protein